MASRGTSIYAARADHVHPFTGSFSAIFQSLSGSNIIGSLFTGSTAQFSTLTIDEYTFPASDGSVGQVIMTDGAGGLSWQAVSGSYSGSADYVPYLGATADVLLGIYDLTAIDINATNLAAIGSLTVEGQSTITYNGAPQLILKGSWTGGAGLLRWQETGRNGFWEVITRNAGVDNIGSMQWYGNTDGSHYHEYMTFFANNAIDTTPGNIQFSGHLIGGVNVEGGLTLIGDTSAIVHKDTAETLRHLTGLRSDIADVSTFVFYSYGGGWLWNVNGTQILALSSSGHLTFDGDTEIYRSSANWLGVPNLVFGSNTFTITNDSVITNLNADMLDGYHYTDYLDQPLKTTSSPTFNFLTLTSGLTLGTGGTSTLTLANDSSLVFENAGGGGGTLTGLKLGGNMDANYYNISNLSTLTFVSSKTINGLYDLNFGTVGRIRSPYTLSMHTGDAVADPVMRMYIASGYPQGSGQIYSYESLSVPSLTSRNNTPNIFVGSIQTPSLEAIGPLLTLRAYTTIPGVGNPVAGFGSVATSRINFYDENLSVTKGPKIHFNASNPAQITGIGDFELIPLSKVSITGDLYVSGNIHGSVAAGARNALLGASIGTYTSPPTYLSIVGSQSAGSGNESQIQQVVPFNGNLKNFYLNLSDNPGSGNSITFYLRVNGNVTPLAVNISNYDWQGNDTSNIVSVNAGDLICFGTYYSGTITNYIYYRWGVEFDSS